eukprot:Em0010g19a
MTPLSDWLNVLPRGSGIAGVTELPLPPKVAAELPRRQQQQQSCPRCHQQQQQQTAPPPPAEAAAELPPPPPAEAGAPPLPQPAPAVLTSVPPLPLRLLHPGRCHHHPHGSHGQNQAGGDKEDKAEQ